MKIILSKWYHCHKYLSAKFYADAQRVSSLPLVIIPTLHDAIQWDSYVGVYLNGLNRHHQPRSCTTELWELNLLSEVQTCTEYMKRILYSVKAKEPLFRFWRNDHSKKTINRIKRNIQLYLEGTWVNECHKYINENVKISWPKTLCQMREKWIVATMKFFSNCQGLIMSKCGGKFNRQFYLSSLSCYYFLKINYFAILDINVALTVTFPLRFSGFLFLLWHLFFDFQIN